MAIDHKGWFAAQPHELPPHDDPNATFRFVTMRHPYNGCACDLDDMPSVTALLSMKTTEAAAYADAVTVWCVEKYRAKIGELRQTSIRNTAYVAIHHTDAAMRAHHESLMQDLRSASIQEPIPLPTGTHKRLQNARLL